MTESDLGESEVIMTTEGARSSSGKAKTFAGRAPSPNNMGVSKKK